MARTLRLKCGNDLEYVNNAFSRAQWPILKAAINSN